MRFLDDLAQTVLGKPAPLSGARITYKDYRAVADFLRKMIDTFGNESMPIRKLALHIVFPAVADRDKREQALAIAEWVQKNIHYVHEGAERFQKPTTTVKTKAGDCDDHTVLVLSLLKSIGIDGRGCIIAINGRWAHIFPVALIPTPDGLHRMTLDTTLTESVRELVNPIVKVSQSGRRVTGVMFL